MGPQSSASVQVLVEVWRLFFFFWLWGRLSHPNACQIISQTMAFIIHFLEFSRLPSFAPTFLNVPALLSWLLCFSESSYGYAGCSLHALVRGAEFQPAPCWSSPEPGWVLRLLRGKGTFSDLHKDPMWAGGNLFSFLFLSVHILSLPLLSCP